MKWLHSLHRLYILIRFDNEMNQNLGLCHYYIIAERKKYLWKLQCHLAKEVSFLVYFKFIFHIYQDRRFIIWDISRARAIWISLWILSVLSPYNYFSLLTLPKKEQTKPELLQTSTLTRDKEKTWLKKWISAIFDFDGRVVTGNRQYLKIKKLLRLLGFA